MAEPSAPSHSRASPLELARAVALEGAELAARRRREGVAVAATKSSLTDVVTAADREVEELIRGRLADARPADGFFGEEGERRAGESGLTWVVDPIDGTVNYLYGIPFYAVSVAAVEGDPGTEPQTTTALAGVVANPAMGEVFEATRGGVARRNGEALRAAPPASLAEALVGTGFSYRAERRVEQAASWARMAGEVRDLRRCGASSLDVTGVACGRLDAYFESGLQPYDHAASSLIAREAGIDVRGIGGAREGVHMLLAAHPAIADAFEELVVRAGAAG